MKPAPANLFLRCLHFGRLPMFCAGEQSPRIAKTPKRQDIPDALASLRLGGSILLR
jgi:hypothetical protein